MNPLLRSVVSVVVGYMVFAAPSFAVFQLSGQSPHGDAPLSLMAMTIVCGVLFALSAGYMAGWLAGRRPLAHSLGVAALLALGAGASLAASIGREAIWSQLAALALMAPSAVIGGWLRERAVASGAGASAGPRP